MANQIVVIAIVAIGMTLVIITGGIDLSVGSLIALSAVVTGTLIARMGGTEASTLAMLTGALAAILMCGVVGFFSGVMVAGFRMAPFPTLGMMLVASGAAYLISGGESRESTKSRKGSSGWDAGPRFFRSLTRWC